MEAIAKWIRHNQGLFVALIISEALLLWTFGCESRVGSLTTPDKLVTRDELSIEISAEQARLENELVILQKQAEAKLAQLDRQDAIKKQLLDFWSLSLSTGQVNPVGLVGLLSGILGVGVIVDNRIKDKVIKNRPLPVVGNSV